MKILRFIPLALTGLLLVFGSPFSSAQNNLVSKPVEVHTVVHTDDIHSAPEPVQASPASIPSTRLWNLQDADILSIINEVSQETGKNFVVDPRVSGKITLISSKPIAQDDVYEVFLSILGQLGYSAVPGEGVIKIVPNMESAEQGTRVATAKAPGKGDEVVVRVIPLENISAMQVISSIRPLLPQWSNISAYTPGNVLILTGRANNLKRIVQLIHEVDKTTNNNIEVVPLHHASASQISTVLNNLQNSARATGEAPSISIAVDERSNNIILSGTKAARIKTRMLISQLDAPASSGSGNTEVIYLRYLKAKEMAPLLSKVALNMMGKSGGAEPSPAAAVTSGGKGGSSTASANPSALTNIQAELSTNALVITAPAAIMQALKSVVARLDVRPAQVLIEAVIAEIDEGDVKNLGIQWGTLTSPGNLPSSPDGMLPTNFPIPGAGNIGIIPNMQIRAVLNLLENINGANILSTPSVVVLDNHKASIEVGQDVPEQSGSYSTTGSTATVTPFNTIDRKRVSLQLDVIPQINLGNAVRLAISLKNDSLRNPDNPGLNPLINISKIKNDVIVNSDNILVIGGLISNNLNENINKVPILGDIPLLGLAFQQKSRSFSKKVLITFIKPIILRNAEDATLITHTKYDAMRQTQINEPYEFKKIGKRLPPNILPPWGSKVDLPKPFNG
jgi:general secretion pathway protein D